MKSSCRIFAMLSLAVACTAQRPATASTPSEDAARARGNAPDSRQRAVDADRAEGSGSDVVTTAELRRLDQGLTVFEAIEQARPWFLHPRGSVALVSVDHAPATEASVLRAITVGDVKEIRLLRAAGQSGPPGIRADGSVAVGDVVLVLTANGRPYASERGG